jgi:hypothetical protein
MWQEGHEEWSQAVEHWRNERYERDAHSSSDANVHVVLGFVHRMAWGLFSSPVEPYQKEEWPFVNEATGTTDAGGNSVPNHPKGLGKERVREEVELQWGEVEALSKQMSRKRWAKQAHSLAVAWWSCRILDTVLGEDRDGNGKDERCTKCAESHCAQVCALAPLRDDQPDSVTFHRVAAKNLIRQILL